MILTIKHVDGANYVVCKDKRFHEVWGEIYKLSTFNIYNNLQEIASWCNNDLKEECLFEID